MIATRPRPPRSRPSTADVAPTARPVRATTGPTRPRVTDPRGARGERDREQTGQEAGERQQEAQGVVGELRDDIARDHGHDGDLRRGGHDAHALDRRRLAARPESGMPRSRPLVEVVVLHELAAASVIEPDSDG